MGKASTKFVEVHVKGAATYQDARKAAEAIANSALVKCSWYGEDPNWGRVMDAVGYSLAKVREEMIDIFFNGASQPSTGWRAVLRRKPSKKFSGTKNLRLPLTSTWVRPNTRCLLPI